MTKLLKENLSIFFKSFLTKWLEDFFILMGLGVILFTTYNEFGYMIGNYSLGFVFLVFGFLIAKR